MSDKKGEEQREFLFFLLIIPCPYPSPSRILFIP